MIKLENTEALGWEAAIRGMRNPMNSWEKSDSWFKTGDFADFGSQEVITRYHRIKNQEESLTDDIRDKNPYVDSTPDTDIGSVDHDLMMRLAKAGSVDAKYRRMIVVTVDITAPLYWWKEFDTYKVGTVANSCSTMHKIQAKKFTLEDFSHEHLIEETDEDKVLDGTKYEFVEDGLGALRIIIEVLNRYRSKFLETKDKRYWWQMIQLLPSSYNQRRTVMLNYEVLAGIYPKRKDHKLDEWREFCDWIKTLPYSEIITLEENKE